MARYSVTFQTGAWFHVTIDAEHEEAAIEEAYEQLPEICAQCTGWGREYELELGAEWDVGDVEEVES